KLATIAGTTTTTKPTTIAIKTPPENRLDILRSEEGGKNEGVTASTLCSSSWPSPRPRCGRVGRRECACRASGRSVEVLQESEPPDRPPPTKQFLVRWHRTR